MTYYVIKSYDTSRVNPVEYWTGGTSWSVEIKDAARFPLRWNAEVHIETMRTMNWRKHSQETGSITVERMDYPPEPVAGTEFAVEIVRTETTKHVVRVRANDENEAKDIVYKQDCNDAYASVFEETDPDIETQYYVTEV